MSVPSAKLTLDTRSSAEFPSNSNEHTQQAHGEVECNLSKSRHDLPTPGAGGRRGGGGDSGSDMPDAQNPAVVFR
jgi:hypothetical protein